MLLTLHGSIFLPFFFFWYCLSLMVTLGRMLLLSLYKEVKESVIGKESKEKETH